MCGPSIAVTLSWINIFVASWLEYYNALHAGLPLETTQKPELVLDVAVQSLSEVHW